MDELRYGIIGTGMMGVEHIENINALDGARVVAIADPATSSLDAGRVAAEHQVAAFADYRALLDDGGCDAVVVASPNMTHIDVLKNVLSTDLAVLVEKPMCTTVEDCQTVVELTEARQALVWVGLEYRYMPPVAKLIERLTEGEAGNIHMIAIREHRFPFLPKVDDWNRFNRNTGGTLVEKCCHFFDLMSLIAGSKATRVMASGGQSVNHLDESYGGHRSDILDNAFVIVEHENGVRGMLDLCMFAEATHNQEEISVVGDKAKLEILMPENVIRVGRRGEHDIGRVAIDQVVDASIPYGGYHYGSSYIEHRKFAEAVRAGAEPEVTAMDGLLSVATGVAAHISIEQQRPVLLSEVL